MRGSARLPSIGWVCLLVPLLGLLTTASCPGLALAQTSGATEETLQQEFTDPLTTLPQVVIRDSYSPATYGTHVQTNAVIVRPIIPRIPAYALLPFIQLIRPSLAVVTVPGPRGRKPHRVRRHSTLRPRGLALAEPQVHRVPGHQSIDRPPRPASDELLRHWAMYALSAIRANRASDDGELWHDNSLSRVRGMVKAQPGA